MKKSSEKVKVLLCTKKAKDAFEQVEKVVWSLAAMVYSHS